MVEESVWVADKFVRPRLSHDQLWLIYRLVDHQYWLLRKQPNPTWNLEKVSRLRSKLLRNLNRNRKPKYRISVRERVY
jgi:hypothetical protein